MRARWPALLVAALLSGPSCGPAQKPANPIRLENARPAPGGWQIEPANAIDYRHQVEGYADRTSYRPGDTVLLQLSTGFEVYAPAGTDADAALTVYRVGWYGGSGAREVTADLPATSALDGGVSIARVPLFRQAVPAADSAGMVDCHWSPGYAFTIPAGWVSGYYLVKIHGNTTGKESWIVFVVREGGARRAAILVLAATNTWQAYNTYPNGNVYSSARNVSFNRPYQYGTPISNPAAGAGDLIGHSQAVVKYSDGWEMNLLRWLERSGYDVSYTTDTDLHEEPGSLLGHKALIVAGHSEYWSWAMRDGLDAAIAAGVHVADLSSNTSYWQVRLEDSKAGGCGGGGCVKDRVMVAWKSNSASDPECGWNGSACTGAEAFLTTTNFFLAPALRSEGLSFGVRYETNPVDGDMTITAPSHWIFAGTGAVSGTLVPGVFGAEVDGVFTPHSTAWAPSTAYATGALVTQGGNLYQARTAGASAAAGGPAGTGFGIADGTVVWRYQPLNPATQVVLAHTRYTANGGGYGDMAIYQAASGAFVWATGAFDWSWGLDDFTNVGRPPRASAIARRITGNFLTRAGAAP